jgi:hypothetical protein
MRVNRALAFTALMAFSTVLKLQATVTCNDVTSGSRASAPVCPTNGNTMLDDTYPAQAYVVSHGAYSDSATAHEMPANFVFALFESHNFTDMPAIFVPTTDDSFTEIVEGVRQRLVEAGRNPPEVDAMLERMVQIPASPYTWQQDHFESFVNPSTGNPVLRHVESYGRYDRKGEVLDSIANSGLACGTNHGLHLTRPDYSSPSVINELSGDIRMRHEGTSQMGGNIEALPGGYCMVGNTQATEYTRQFCGPDSNRVTVRTDWLEVGHADEIIKALPRVPRTGPCPYTFMFASPRKAEELMRAQAGIPVVDFGDISLTPAESYQDRLRAQAYEYFTASDDYFNSRGRMFCELYLKRVAPRRGVTPGTSPTTVPEAETTYLNLQNLFLDKAHAQEELSVAIDIVKDANTERPDYDYCLNNITELLTITNGEFIQGWNEDSNYQAYNQEVQRVMDQEKAQIRARYPACGDANFVDVPNLFYGEFVKGVEPPQLDVGTGASMFPNPTNGVRAHNSMIFSDPHNSAFREYLSGSAIGGLQARFVDTWNYAHLGSGNLHCSTHTIRYCRPAPAAGGTP